MAKNKLSQALSKSWLKKALISVALILSYLGLVYGFAWKYHKIYEQSPESYFMSKDFEEAAGHKALYDILKVMSQLIDEIKSDSTFMNDERELYNQMMLAEILRKQHRIPKKHGLDYKPAFDEFLFFSATLGSGDIRPISGKVRTLLIAQNLIAAFYLAVFGNLIFSLFKRRSQVLQVIHNRIELNNASLEDILKVGIPKSIAKDVINSAPYTSASNLIDKVERIGAKRLAILLDNFCI